MGIFDAFRNLTPDQNEGLLAAAAALLQAGGPSTRPVGLGQAFGASLEAFQQGTQKARDQRFAGELQNLRLSEAQNAAQEAQSAREQNRMIQEAARAAVSNGNFDQESFLRNVTQVDPLKSLEFQRQMAKAGPEFDTTPRVSIGPDGKPFTYILSKTGEQKRLDDTLPRDELKLAQLGGQDVAYNPFQLKPGQTFQRSASPDAMLSAATARRGQDLTDTRARESLALDMKKVAQADKPSKEAAQRIQDANDVISILNEAEDLIPKSTSSYLGTGYDMAARTVGAAPEGARVAAQLKVLQGTLVSKMPKMSGPQSDKDVQLYREMAGQIGDSTLPVETRLAAARTLRNWNESLLGLEKNSSLKKDQATPAAQAGGQGKRISLADIAETARRSGRSTAEVTAAARAKGYTIGSE